MNGTFSVRPPQQHCQLKVFELWKLSRFAFFFSWTKKKKKKSNLGQANSHNRSSLFFSFLSSSDSETEWKVKIHHLRCVSFSRTVLRWVFPNQSSFHAPPHDHSVCRKTAVSVNDKGKRKQTNHIYSQWFQSKSLSLSEPLWPHSPCQSGLVCGLHRTVWGWNAQHLCRSSFSWLNSANIILDLHHYFSCLHKKVPSRYWQRLRNEWNHNTWRTGAELM